MATTFLEIAVYIYFVRKAWPRNAYGLMILNTVCSFTTIVVFFCLFYSIFLDKFRKHSFPFGEVLEKRPFKRGDSLIESEEVQINEMLLKLFFVNELQ